MQGKSRYLQADVSKVVDNSNPMKAKNVQLRYPLRLRVRKSPVLIHYDLRKVNVSEAHVEISYIKIHMSINILDIQSQCL